ncbi:glycoside hydrolase family 88 protein [Pseudomaricurvus alcaniphilus]|uniref:glycoside hydrolase family 88 protein n=1 Tax=Pseudomaricurvus alcaniphilus TaxID=1166482 RepID=UPI001A9DBA6C|nr:glycoside hydrolase family 88 protein [Pseudomaricurvus alcaniphilus]
MKKTTNRNSMLLLAAMSVLVAACGEQQADASKSGQPAAQLGNTAPIRATVDIANPVDHLRRDQAIYLDMAQLGLRADADTAQLGFYRGDQVVAHQFIDSDADGQRDQALVMLDLQAGEKLQLALRDKSAADMAPQVQRSHAEIGVKAGGNWQGSKYEGGVFQDVEAVTLPPQYTDHSQFLRYEGPGIESDVIGYRVYLDWRNGFDIFGKQQAGLQLAQVGLDGYQSYHEPADWGMDILKVGKSVGIGGFGYWENGALTRVSEVKGWSARIVEDGSLYSAFAINYDDWTVAGKTVDVRAQLAMVAGSRLARVNLKTDPGLEQLAVGLVKHADTEVLKGSLDITGEAWSYLATLGPQALDGQPLLMFVLFKRETLVELTEDEHNQVALLKVRGGELEYYFGAQWAGEPGADLSPAAVNATLAAEVERLTYPPRLALGNRASDSLKQELGGAANALQWSKLAAVSEIERHGMELAHGQYDTMREREANWEYTMGLLTQGVYQVGQATGEARLTQWAQSIVDSYVTDTGELRGYDQSQYNIDSINSGKMLLQLYRDTGAEKYRIAAGHLREQLHHHPRLDAGAFWHKQRYPYQLWLDGVYMGMPFLAEYSVLFENGASLDEVMEEFRVTREHLRDPATGLYWHAWDEKRQQGWADSDTGLSHYFWARGMGWLAMAIVDTYAIIPAERAGMRAELAAMAQDLADSLLKFQDDNGVWHQIVDMPGKTGNYPESSASAMFTYMLVKGVQVGALPDSYRGAALRAYDALIEQFVLADANGSVHLTQACQVGGLGFGRDGSYAYYMSEPVIDNDPKGLGPFLMLGPLAQQVLNP